MAMRRNPITANHPLLVCLVLSMTCPLWGAEAFDYFQNSWSVIGLKDYAHGTRITPDNELILGNNEKIQIRVGRGLDRLSQRQAKALSGGWLPIVLLSTHDEGVRYDFKLWATPLPTLKNWRQAFDWPTEGENYLNWILVTVTNSGSVSATAKLRVDHSGTATQVLRSHVWSLEPGQRVEAVVRIPFLPVEDAEVFSKEDASVWLERTVQYWQDTMAGAARIEVPCVKATDALPAAHVCQLIANDHGELHGGEGFYDQFYIRDGGYQIMELEEAGLLDAAGKAIDYYLRSQRSDGRFETQKGQLDANGQALWVLWQYFKITGNEGWLAKVYPQMRRAVDWMTLTRRNVPADSPFAGLLPAAVADGEYLWDGKHHIVGYDFWNLRGLLCTADAAKVLGRNDEAEELLDEAERYRKAIDAAWKRAGLSHFPPSWEKEGTHWGNTETLWPTELFARDDPRVTALINHARQQHGGGFIEGTIQWLGRPDAIHPYMSAYTTMACLDRGEHEQVVEDFYWYLLHSSATHAFPEGIYYKRRFAWNHTIPHVTGASNFALMLRHMLLHERGDELHLLLGVPDGWLAQGEEIHVERAPTHFGIMDFHVFGTAEGVRVNLKPPSRHPPKRIVLHLPESRPLVGTVAGLEVARRSDQKRKWDFESVVQTYLRIAPPQQKPIEALVSMPLADELSPEACRTLDLGPLANTDPFTAPFGVANPGKLLFTGLPVGMIHAGGVPFKIIDPSKNNGYGFVVLHSPKAPKHREWPRHAEIPVDAVGRRLFFLGNVHGWGAGGAGAGEWQALAEYVIHYVDGQTQRVPLVDGRTTDDWTAPHQVAVEVVRGLEGKPWHLNVLGVKLRPVRVEKVVFHDLGTSAAPLLAAVTLEK